MCNIGHASGRDHSRHTVSIAESLRAVITLAVITLPEWSSPEMSGSDHSAMHTRLVPCPGFAPLMSV